MKQSPAQVLRLIEALPETPDNFRLRNEIIASFKEFVATLEPVK